MYTNLHAHTIYSTQDGHALVDEYVQRGIALGHSAIAVTDHGNMGAMPEFFKQCSDLITPIAGCEIYMVPQSRELRGEEYRKSYHLTLLAMNETGYKNLVKLSSRAYLEGTYYVPRADYDLLNEYADGVICLSGCIASLIAQQIIAGDRPESTIQTLQEIYGERFFLELQNHGLLLPSQRQINTELLRYARKHQIPAVGTNDSHFCAPTDAVAHRYLIDAKSKGNLKSSPYTYFRDNEQMVRAFGEGPLINNTLAIAEMCERYPLGSSRPRLPKSPLEREGETPADTLRRLCLIGLRKRLGEIPREYLDRLNYEMEVIGTMGRRLEVPFERYFLLIADLTRFAREHRIRYAPRGSAAGSLILWALKISELDPIHYGLLFERFLNPDRLELPDIDTDFADDRRDEIFQYLLDTYGVEHVARIGTYGAFGPKGAIRDAAKIHQEKLAEGGIRYFEFSGQLSHLIPHSQNPAEQTLKKVLAEPHSPLKERTEIDADAKMVIDTALQLAGRLKSTGTHAAGVVVSDTPLMELVPLRNVAKEDGKKTEIITTQTQYEMGALEGLGLIKMDILGLSELAKTEQTVQLIKQRHGIELDLWNLPLDDRKVWKIFTSGHTLGLFQLAGANMTKAISMISPTSIADLALVIAVFRPGPVENLDILAARKHGRAPVIPLHEACEELLRITYGLPVYQEQVMELFRIMAGYSLAEADSARKAMGKKITVLMEKHEIKFKAGCAANGYTEEEADRVWQQIQPFANYGFNKSHAFAYALLAYQSAYLKQYFPQEFFTAALDTEARISRANTTSQERIGAFAAEAKHFGITILAPDINLSTRHFEPVNKTDIRFPLSAVKNVSDTDIGRILRKRPFTSLSDVIEKISPNRKSLEALILSGSLPWGNRAQLMRHATQLMEIRDKYKNPPPRKNETKELAQARGMLRVHQETAKLQLTYDVPEYDDIVLLGHDLDYLGISRTPFPELIGVPITSSIARLGETYQPRQSVRVAGMIIALKPFTTKVAKKRMARGVIFDGSGRIEMLLWESTWLSAQSWLKPKMLVSLLGDLEVQREEELAEGEPIPVSNLTLRVNRIDELALPSLSRTTDLLIPPVVPQDEARLLFATIAHLAMNHPGTTCISVRYRTQREDIWVSADGARHVANMLTALVAA